MNRQVEGAFAALVERCHANVYRAAYRVLRHPQDAEDVVQQVFVDLLRSGPLDARSACDVLCWRASRYAANHLRGERNRDRRETRYAMERNDTANPPPDATTAVREHLDRLPDELRLPLVLRFENGMTFADVADALRCAESTAHERVRRGLDALRDRLAKAALPLVALDLETLLRAPAPVSVPSGLAARLLALTPKAAAAAVPVTAALLLVGTLAAGALLWPTPPTPPSRVDDASGRASNVVVDASPARVGDAQAGQQDPTPARRPVVTSAPPVDTQDAPLRRGTILGLVRDEIGLPIANALLIAASTEFEGKSSRFAARARSAADGSFRIDVDVDGRVQRYTVSAEAEGRLRAHSGVVVVDPSAPPTPIDLQLRRPAPPAEGAYRLAMTIVDGDGRPVSGLFVQLYPRTEPYPVEHVDAVEARGKTDANGVVEIAGNGLGEKHLRVASSKTTPPALFAVPVVRAGRTELRLQLPAAVGLTGVVRAIDSPICRTLLRVTDLTNGIDLIASLAADGRFALPQAGPGPFRITAQGGPWSRFVVDDVVGGTDVSLTLKRFDDPTQRGLHMAELHGKVVDGETTLRIGWPEVFWRRLEPGASLDDLVVAELHPPSVQTAMGDRSCDSIDGAFVGADRDLHEGFHFDGLDEGRYVLFARMRDDGLAVEGPVDLARGQVRSDLVVRKRDGVAVRGRVTDGAARPLADAHVLLLGFDAEAEQRIRAVDEAILASNGRSAGVHTTIVRTAADGTFTVTNVPRGLRVRVGAFHVAHTPATGAPFTTGTADAPPVVLPPR